LKKTLADAFKDRFGVDPDNINANHRMVIVAAASRIAWPGFGRFDCPTVGAREAGEGDDVNKVGEE